jgi:hypothetical protein
MTLITERFMACPPGGNNLRRSGDGEGGGEEPGTGEHDRTGADPALQLARRDERPGKRDRADDDVENRDDHPAFSDAGAAGLPDEVADGHQTLSLSELRHQCHTRERESRLIGISRERTRPRDQLPRA